MDHVVIDAIHTSHTAAFLDELFLDRRKTGPRRERPTPRAGYAGTGHDQILAAAAAQAIPAPRVKVNGIGASEPGTALKQGDFVGFLAIGAPDDQGLGVDDLEVLDPVKTHTGGAARYSNRRLCGLIHTLLGPPCQCHPGQEHEHPGAPDHPLLRSAGPVAMGRVWSVTHSLQEPA